MTEKTEGTPRPWRVMETGEDDPEGILSGPSILSVETVPFGQASRCVGYIGTLADASLIVKAVNSYDALREVAERSQILSRSIRERGFTGETWKCVDDWRAALKKLAV